MYKNVDMKQLFAPVKNKPKVDPSYKVVEQRLALKTPKPINDITYIAKWFKAKYEDTYKKPMLGYNFYNCRNTIQLLARKYECSHWDVCCYINKWFKTFHSLGYDKVAGDSSLTLSVLKTDWIISGLVDNRRPNESKRNSSFKTHGESRRNKKETNSNKTQISKESF